MKNGKLGVCVVGCGDLGTVHALRWQRLAEAEVVAVVDVDQERACKLAETCGLDQNDADYRDAIVRSDVDVVSVCVPTALHVDVAVFAMEHGKHAISEKPIGLTLEAADRMIAAAERHGVKLALGFMRRHSPVLPALRTWLAAGHLGRPVLYQARDYRQIRPKRVMHDANVNGGPVIDMGVHLFDLWSYIFDAEPVEVFARGFTFAKGREELRHIEHLAVDTADISVRFASGDVGTFSVCWGLPPTVTPEGTPDVVLGPRGAAHVQYGRDHQELTALHEGREWETVAVCKQDMYQLEIANFAHAILNDEAPLAGGQDGRRALQVALAALRSIAAGLPVRVVDVS
ncbi:MAG: Gfo/Idh/MocA family oxidoreductase [Anaerolineae bacterium]|nr:Gfo/Idh/MocA family oxidoreductase [Anaerolineae bacterium]